MTGRKRLGFVAVGLGVMFVVSIVNRIESKVEPAQLVAPRHLVWLGHEEIFKELERPPVAFDHDGHTRELAESDCKTCHTLEKKLEEKELRVYFFPKQDVTDAVTSPMEGYHVACTTCHKQQRKEGKKAGPITCGVCHVESRIESPAWQEMGYDYAIHNKHVQAMESKCELCHHIYDEEQKKLIYEKGTESSCRDCHGLVVEENRRSFRQVAHAQCLDCHMSRKKEGLASGPSICAGCHGEREKMSIAEMAKLPRLPRDQKDQIHLQSDNGRMKATPFDHKAHEGRVRFCRDCHHSTHKPCSSCHTLSGNQEGADIILEAAFHSPDSRLSCLGCHDERKQSAKCLGCHLLDDREISEHMCSTCHRGTEDAPQQEHLGRRLEALPEEKFPEKVEIKIMENEYDPAVMPHKKIVNKLLELSDNSSLAEHFHADRPAICLGCHHESPFDLNEKPPACSSCHGVGGNPIKLDRPGLMGSYHRQCMGCHREMEIKALGCADCHKEKISPTLQVVSTGSGYGVESGGSGK